MLDSEDLKINSFISISLSIDNEQDESSHLPWSVLLPSLIEFKCGRSIIHSIQFIQILDITVDKELKNAASPNWIEFKCGRSIH